MLLTLLLAAQGIDFPAVLGFGVLLAFSLEVLTVWCRFGRGMTASRDTAFIGRITRGVRIHHGYLGVPIAALALVLSFWFQLLADLMVVVSIGLILSDLMHHFLVLWPITGSHEFHLKYPIDDAAVMEPDADQA